MRGDGSGRARTRLACGGRGGIGLPFDAPPCLHKQKMEQGTKVTNLHTESKLSAANEVNKEVRINRLKSKPYIN